MAREVRVLAEPDFPRTIFVEIQTNEMSADWISKMATHRPKKVPLKKQKICTVKITVTDERGLEGSLRGTFPLKRFLSRTPLPHSLPINTICTQSTHTF